MDFKKLIADGLINVVENKRMGKKYYVWSDKVERPIIPFCENNQYFGEKCDKCGSTLRYKYKNGCVQCRKEGTRLGIEKAYKKREEKRNKKYENISQNDVNQNI